MKFSISQCSSAIMSRTVRVVIFSRKRHNNYDDVIITSQVRVLHRLRWNCNCSCVLIGLGNKPSKFYFFLIAPVIKLC